MNRSRSRRRIGLACAFLTCGLAFTGGGPRPTGRTVHGPWLDRTSGKMGPASWFMTQRISTGEPIPERALSRALEKYRDKAGASVLVPGTWVNVGPYNIGGRVTALAVDPIVPTHLWLGSAAGGVWTSTDNGVNWSSVFDGQTAPSIGSIAVHPTDSNVVYVGTGEDNGGGFSYDGEGVFKTTNGGASWTNVGLAATRRIGKIAVHPTDPSRVFVAAGGGWFNTSPDRGIYRSLDGGSTWQKVLYIADDTGGIDLAIDPSNPSRVFAALWQRQSAGASWYIGGPNSGIWRSLDGGDTWAKLTNGLPAMAGRIGIALAPGTPSTIYACVINTTGGLDGIYRSTDSGNTWTKRSDASVPPQLSGFSYYFSQIRVDPANVNTVYVLDTPLLRSTNGGQTFATIASSVHVDWHDLIVEAGGRWLAGTDGGFFRSLNGGGAWFKAVTLPITQLYDLGIARANPAVRFTGAQDNFTLRTTDAGTSDWTSVLGGDGLQCEVDYTNANIVYAESQFGAIRRSTNGGANWSVATGGIPATDRKNWNTPITLDPIVPTRLYTGTQRVYRTTDSAASWTAISPDLTNAPPPAPGMEEETPAVPIVSDEHDHHHGPNHLENLVRNTITVVSVSSPNTAFLWVGTDDGNVWVSDDAGANFDLVTPPGTQYWVTDIEPSRLDPRTAYLTVTGYRQGSKLPYVRVTRDLGQTWEDLSDGLPQIPVNTILPSSEWRGRLFLGNDVGVFLSDDDGLTWSEMRAGMPYAVAMDLVEHSPSRTLFAATHARSIYTFDLTQLPAPDGDGDGVDNNADCALRDGGAFASPAEVASLSAAREKGADVLVTWSSLASQAGNGVVYDLASGSLADLAVSGTSGAAALVCAQGLQGYVDSRDLLPGEGVYYLVRGRNVCGLGSWGRNSQGVERTVAACP